jgi:hypothetical protein
VAGFTPGHGLLPGSRQKAGRSGTPDRVSGGSDLSEYASDALLAESLSISCVDIGVVAVRVAPKRKYGGFAQRSSHLEDSPAELS